MGGGWRLPEIQRQRVYLGLRVCVQGGHSGPEALGSSLKHPQPATGSGGLCCMEASVILSAWSPPFLPGRLPPALLQPTSFLSQGGFGELGREHIVSYSWAQRKVVVEPRCHPANVKGCPSQNGSPTGVASGAKLRKETASPRDLALALEGSPGAQGLGGKGLSNKLSTPTAFSMPTHRPPGVCSVELGGSQLSVYRVSE